MTALAACTELYQTVSLPKGWEFIRDRGELCASECEKIYFIHWHWKVPDAILKKVKCIGFHMTDLPWGRGSRPYERLIEAGFRETVLSCFEMEPEYDTGDILMKRIVSLEGDKEKAMRRVYGRCMEMIRHIEAYGPPMRVPQC